MDIEIDAKDVATKLAFLVGKTILFRNGHEDATTAAQVVAVKVENASDLNGKYPIVHLYTSVGIQNITDSLEFDNIMVLDSDGSLKCLGDYADDMGICF